MPKIHRVTRKSRKQVESLAAVGIQQEVIGEILGITSKTLRAHYKAELKVSSAKANAAVAGQLYKAAVGGDVRAQIFWCKRGYSGEKRTIWKSQKRKTLPPCRIPN